MITIKLTESDVMKMAEEYYLGGELRGERPEKFIFDKYTISVKADNGAYHEVMVNRTEDTFSMYGFEGNKKFLFLKAKCIPVSKDTLGIDILGGRYIEDLMNDKTMNYEQKTEDAKNGVQTEHHMIALVETYIMLKLKTQKTDIDYVKRDLKRMVVGQRPSKKKKKVDKPIEINLNDIARVINVNKGTKQREKHTDSWEVRGHYRHYKSGKIVFVKPFIKGNKEIAPNDREYTIK